MAFFAASVDPAETNREFAESLEANYPILSDPEKETARAWGVLSPRGFASRWTFYIDDEGVIRHIDKEVNVRSAGEDVLRQLQELGMVK